MRRWSTVSVVEVRVVSTRSAIALTSTFTVSPATLNVTGKSAALPTVTVTPSAIAFAKPRAVTLTL